MIALDHHKAARVGVAAALATAALAVAPLGHDVSFAHPSAVAAASGPVVRYGTYLGGSFSDMATAVAVDRFGNVYVTGSTMSPNFILRHAFQSRCGGCADGAYSGSGDAFVAKFSNKGGLIYSTYLGGRNDDAGTAITVDRSGNAFVVGTTSSPDFPTDHAIQRDNNGGTDAFLTELDPQGGVVFSTYLGGSDDDEAHAVTTDGHGRIYVAGSTMSTDFPVKGGVQATLKGHTNAWIGEFTRDGAALAYSTYLGGTGDDEANGIAVDRAGNAYVVGSTTSHDFPVVGAFQSTPHGGGSSAFVAKLNAAGSALTYSTYLGGTGDETGNAIALDRFGDAFVTGSTSSSDFPTAHAAYRRYNSDDDAYVTALSSAGNSLLYSTYLGGNGRDVGLGIAVDASGDAYVAGSTESTTFPTYNAIHAHMRGRSAAFVSEFNPRGTYLRYSTYLGGHNTTQADAIATDGRGNAYVVGDTTSSDFGSMDGTDDSYNGATDAYVVRVSDH